MENFFRSSNVIFVGESSPESTVASIQSAFLIVLSAVSKSVPFSLPKYLKFTFLSPKLHSPTRSNFYDTSSDASTNVPEVTFFSLSLTCPRPLFIQSNMEAFCHFPRSSFTTWGIFPSR